MFSLKYYEKLKQKKYRQEERKFLIEGDNLLSECLESGKYLSFIEAVFVRRDYSNTELLKKIYSVKPDIRVDDLTESVFNKLSETVKPQGIIACVRYLHEEDIKINFDCNLTVALDNINDPGNLGTIIRTCYWFGIKNILLGNETADFHNSKVIRASQGAVFHVDLIKTNDLLKSLKEYGSNNFIVFLSDIRADEFIGNVKIDPNDKIIIAFGNESNGISENILSVPEFKQVKIRGFSECESLNVAVSAGIILNEFSNRLKSNS